MREIQKSFVSGGLKISTTKKRKKERKPRARVKMKI